MEYSTMNEEPRREKIEYQKQYNKENKTTEKTIAKEKSKQISYKILDPKLTDAAIPPVIKNTKN